MNLTLPSVVSRLLAIPTPHERLPLDLLQSLVWYGWRDLEVCAWHGAIPDGETPLQEPGCDMATIPAWGLGVVALTVGVANWGVGVLTPTDADLVLERERARLPWPADPAGTRWTGPGAKSGKHMVILGGGLGICDLDSSGLLDAYLRWGLPEVDLPGARSAIRELHARDVYAPGGRPIAFDVLRAKGGKRWSAWLAWADRLLALPEFHEWLIGLWLREYWAPSWRASLSGEGPTPTAESPDWQGSETIHRACINVRIRNSAKSWGSKWAHLPADEQARLYVEARREARGDSAAKRTARQVGFAMRAAAAIEAVRLPVLP